MKAVRPDDTECAPGEIGELVGRVVTGGTELEYHGNKAASEAKTRGGWLRTQPASGTPFNYSKAPFRGHNGTLRY